MAENHEHLILIIDDESSIRESLTEFFRDYNMVTMAVASAEEGLDLLERQCYDLAVVDIRLPGINGDQFVMAAHNLCRQMKFIIHTGSVHFRVSPEMAAIGLTEKDVFLKPVFDLELLLDRSRALLQPEDAV